MSTISRKVDQLNFPLDGLDTAHGMTSEIVLLREPTRAIRYTGWFRELQRTGKVIYTGFYITARRSGSSRGARGRDLGVYTANLAPGLSRMTTNGASLRASLSRPCGPSHDLR